MAQVQPWLRLYDFCIDNVAWRPRLLIALLCRSSVRDRVLSLVPRRDEPDYEAKRDAFVCRCLETTESPVDTRRTQEANLILGTDWERVDALAWMRITQDLGHRAPYQFGCRFIRWGMPFANRIWLMLVYAVLGDKKSEDELEAVLGSVRRDGLFSDQWDALPLGQRLACGRWASVRAVDVPVKPYYSTLLALVDRHDPPPTCCICMCEPPSIIFETCGHLCVCKDCWTRLPKTLTKAKCPLCRQTIGRTRRVSYRRGPTPIMSFEEAIDACLQDVASLSATWTHHATEPVWYHYRAYDDYKIYKPVLDLPHRPSDRHEFSSVPPSQFPPLRSADLPAPRRNTGELDRQPDSFRSALFEGHSDDALNVGMTITTQSLQALDRILRTNEAIVSTMTP